MKAPIGWLIALALAASGCAVFAGKDDYADYRAIRLARDEDSRLYALADYAARHPDGLWSREVELERSSRETTIFEAGKGTRAGLERYLRAYPNGAFAAQARARLAAVDVIERRQRESARTSAQLAAAKKARDEELRRTWMTRFAGYWTSTLLGLTGWGDPIPDVARANPRFSRAFGAAPRPRCTAEECLKYYTSQYAVPVPGGTRIERTLSLALRLRMQDGKLVRAELLLPNHGFSRWYEVEQRKPVVSGDNEGRSRAAGWALGQLEAQLTAAGELKPVAGYVLQPIAPPAIAASGELIDPTAEDPSVPPKQVSGLDAPGSAVVAAEQPPEVEALVKPKADQPAPDMEFAPLGVTREGRTFSTAPASPGPATPAAPDTGEVLVMDPVAVPKDEAGTAPASPGGAAPQPSAAPAQVAPVSAIVRAYQIKDLRVVLFAAASDAAAPAYDGVIVERVAPGARPAAGKPGKPRRAPPH